MGELPMIDSLQKKLSSELKFMLSELDIFPTPNDYNITVEKNSNVHRYIQEVQLRMSNIKEVSKEYKKDIEEAVRDIASAIRSMKGLVTLDDDDNEKDVLISKNKVLELLVGPSPSETKKC